jgi:hypothetical protein
MYDIDLRMDGNGVTGHFKAVNYRADPNMVDTMMQRIFTQMETSMQISNQQRSQKLLPGKE